MIEIQHLSKSYGSVKAVDDISFTVQEGERFILVGTSGCGKTTTLKMINRLVEPDRGRVLINGTDHLQQSAVMLRRKMGYVMQYTGLFPHYTIEENISVVPGLLKWETHKTKKRAAELLTKFQMPPEQFLHLYPDQLSGGQQQRVGFARALMANPPVLLMDEPLGALDPVTRIQMQQEFKTLTELKNKTIIMVTHDISEAIELGDRIGVMDKGRIQQTGTAKALLLHPENDFVKNFFSHGRFVLQLKAWRIRDILPLLPKSDYTAASHDISPEMSLMNAIEWLSAAENPSNPVAIFDENQNQWVDISLPLLFNALQNKTNGY